jgi:DNA-binding transcriptional MerR regulator
MSTRIVTLFGEEIVPEQPKPAGKTRGRKKDQKEETPEQPEAEAVAAPDAPEMTLEIEAASAPSDALAEAIIETAPFEQDEAPGALLIITHETDAEVEIPADIIEESAEVNEVAVTEVAEDEIVTEETVDTITELTTEPEVTGEVAKEILELEATVEEPVEEVLSPTITEAESPGTAKPKSTRGRKPVRLAGEGETEPAAEIIPEDWKGEKKYYTIGEVAEFFKVKTSHIRFWTNEFKMKVRTTRKGDRLYTPENVKELRAIYHLVKERGFTLTGAKTKLRAQNKRDVTTVDLKTSLTQFRNKLLILREQLI